MKIVVVVLDGMADLPIPELGGLTPVEYAYAPHIHLLARRGLTGLVKTSFAGLPVESAVANMGILGYDPRVHYPSGRASFEALASGIALKENDLVFRCNLVSLDGDLRIRDFTAGLISDADALRVISSISTEGTPFELYAGQSYRNLLVYRNSTVRANEIVTHPPHIHIGEPIHELRVRGRTAQGEKLAEQLNEFLFGTIHQLKELNRILGTKADMCWVWSPSEKPNLPPFQECTGLRGAVVCGIDTIRGIGIAAKMYCEEIPGATGYSDSNLAGKASAAIRDLDYFDFVYIHINAPDEESHQHSVEGKVRVIERIDREVVGPVVHELRERFSDSFRVVILPDHYTLLSNGQHKPYLVPFVVAGSGIAGDTALCFSEREIARKGKTRIESTQLLELLRRI